MRVDIDNELFESQVRSGMTIVQLQEHWSCSRTTITSRKKKLNLVGTSPNSVTRDLSEHHKMCKGCLDNKPLDHFYSNGYTPKGTKKYKPLCKTCDGLSVFKNHVQRLIEILHESDREYKCELCGYDTNLASLCFHHNTEEKNFDISSSKSLSYDRVRYELSICTVLCTNCHNALHNPRMEKYIFYSTP